MASYIFDARVYVDSDTIETPSDAFLAVQEMLNDYYDNTDDTPLIRIQFN